MKASKDKVDEKLHKPPMYLLPGDALKSVAQVLGHGAKKHGRYSWRDYPVESYLSAMGRHIGSVYEGELVDEEFGETHFAHIAASALFMDWIYHNDREKFNEFLSEIKHKKTSTKAGKG